MTKPILTPPDAIAALLKQSGYIVDREHRFHRTRRWRFDVALVRPKIAIEYDGGTFMQWKDKKGRLHFGGRHNTGTGFSEDCRKLNAAQMLGWVVLRYTVDAYKKRGAAGVVDDVKEVIRYKVENGL